MYCKIVKVGIQIGCSIGVCMSLSGCFEKPKPNIPEFQPKAFERKCTRDNYGKLQGISLQDRW